MKRFKNILYVADFSADQTSAIKRVLALADANQADLTVLLVEDPPRLGILSELLPPDEIDQRLRQQQMDKLKALLAPYERDGLRTLTYIGKPFVEIIRTAIANRHDLVIKAASATGIGDRFFVSQDMHLLRKCPCPVWLMRANETPRYTKILAALDFDPWHPEPEGERLNQRILELSSAIALADFAELHVVHVWDSMLATWADSIAKQSLENQINQERLRYQNGLEAVVDRLRQVLDSQTFDFLSPKLHLLRGEARDEIPQLAASLEVDLLVMGTVARTGVSGLFIGNTAELILNQIDCSVLAIKPDDFVSPVVIE